MQSFLAKISLGYLADRAATIVRWSPLGRRLELRDAEGPHAVLFEGLSGKIISLDGGAIVVACHDRHDQSSRAITTVRLTTRHSGWTFGSLMLLPIAVVATAIGHDGESTQAIAIARIR